MSQNNLKCEQSRIIHLVDGMLCIGESPILNIAYVTGSHKVSFSFNLEKISKEEANKVINEIKNRFHFTIDEYQGHELDYSLILTFDDNISNDEIVDELNDKFDMGIPCRVDLQ